MDEEKRIKELEEENRRIKAEFLKLSIAHGELTHQLIEYRKRDLIAELSALQPPAPVVPLATSEQGQNEVA